MVHVTLLEEAFTRLLRRVVLAVKLGSTLPKEVLPVRLAYQAVTQIPTRVAATSVPTGSISSIHPLPTTAYRTVLTAVVDMNRTAKQAPVSPALGERIQSTAGFVKLLAQGVTAPLAGAAGADALPVAASRIVLLGSMRLAVRREILAASPRLAGTSLLQDRRPMQFAALANTPTEVRLLALRVLLENLMATKLCHCQRMWVHLLVHRVGRANTPLQDLVLAHLARQGITNLLPTRAAVLPVGPVDTVRRVQQSRLCVPKGRILPRQLRRVHCVRRVSTTLSSVTNIQTPQTAGHILALNAPLTAICSSSGLSYLILVIPRL